MHESGPPFANALSAPGAAASPPRPPGPSGAWWGLPLLRALSRDYLGFVQRLQRQYGDLTCMHIAREHAYDIFHPDWIRTLLVDHAGQLVRWERGVEVFAQAHGHSVLITEGATWQRQRRLLTPAFSPKALGGYGRLMAQAAGRRLDAWAPRGAVVDFAHEMTQLTMEVILLTLFGSADAAEALAAENAVQVLSQTAMREMFWPTTLPDWLPLPGKRRKRQALRMLDGLVWRHIDARAATPSSNDAAPDLLGTLLAVRDEQGDTLTPREVRDECMTIFLAGHETTATALTWWGWLMASHPACAHTAAAEVDAALQGRTPEIQDLAAMPYLAATLKEAMRLYPPAPALMSRRLLAPVQLGPWTLPKGALVRLTPWVLHHDPRWFPEPETFKPERFLQSPDTLPRGAYMPFGTGPRVCLGQHFASAEMQLIAALLLQRFTLHVPVDAAPPRPVLNVTLRPANGMPLRLAPIEPSGGRHGVARGALSPAT